VLVMSSVNAGEWMDHRAPPRLGVETTQAAHPWGRTNQRIEAACREVAGGELEIVVIRLGAVWWPDYPSRDALQRRVWLSHEDAGRLFRACLLAPVVPGRLSTLNAVSDVRDRVHDTANPFGWEPRSRTVGWNRWRRARVIAAKSALHGILRRGLRSRP
jgi:hypothetical protein